ncbi:uncharacterized protein CDAR_99411 [Caerostris darwini]|uniref:Uncharacterized protein n=1 Tax=Caerostris darwini TaxID=1538125 RepID=A0AAV4UNQ0_9ARAC|nr:uncharacterized protein CDAR_99411 [Caerostris darwini]
MPTSANVLTHDHYAREDLEEAEKGQEGNLLSPEPQKLEDVPEKSEKEDSGEQAEKVLEGEVKEAPKAEGTTEGEPKVEELQKRWTRPKRPTSILKTKLLVNDVVKFIEEMKQKITQEDGDVRVIPDPSACRFQLPIDMTTLEGLTPLMYVSKHCQPAQTRRKIYVSKYREFCEGKSISTILVSEVLILYEKLYQDTAILDGILSLRRLLDLDLNLELDENTFVVVSCLMERILAKTKGTVSYEKAKRNVFEVTDFCSLNGKLHGVNVSPQLRSLLEYIR